MTSKELRLNSISRYFKTSPRLVLEEHGHCEVPAGCGGVVLRWRNPLKGIPLEIWLYTNGEVKFFLDGNVVSSGRPLLTYGEHVFAFRISKFQTDYNYNLLMFAGIYDEEEMMHVSVSHRSGKQIYILSIPDGTWKYSLTEPPDDSWMYSGFDDSNWSSMALKPFPEPDRKDTGRYRFEKMQEFGAKGLGVENINIGVTVWIRKAFILSEANRS